MSKEDINVFGENSLSHVEKRGLFTYAVVRNCDGKVLAKSYSFKKYIGCSIRTMYTGFEYASGDFVLLADTPVGDKEIYRWLQSL